MTEALDQHGFSSSSNGQYFRRADCFVMPPSAPRRSSSSDSALVRQTDHRYEMFLRCSCARCLADCIGSYMVRDVLGNVSFLLVGA